jgi:membrane protease YdiL (CAAX protease family)
MDILVLVGVLFAAGIITFALGTATMGVWMHTHHVGPAALTKAQTYAFAIPLQALWYLVALGLAIAVFHARWKKSFADGIHWNLNAATTRAWLLIGLGVLLSFVVQIVSSKIKMPHDAPIYELFKNPVLAWTATVFGIFIAPAAEELAFRGFLLPSIGRYTGNAISVVLVSVVFALLHASQIGHAWGAVAALFGVSVVLCLFRLRFNSVAASTLVHMSYNSVLFVAMIYATGGYRHFDKIFPS